MKRTATTLALLAGFGGGCMSTDAKKEPVGFGTVSRGVQVPGVMGPGGEPVMAARGAMPGGSGIVQAGGMMKPDSRIMQAGLLNSNDCSTCAHVPGASAPLFGPHFSKHGSGMGGGYGGGMAGGMGGYQPGIFPVPGQGPPGAVAAVGAIVPGMGGGFGGGAAMAAGRTSIKFVGPAGMKITWQLPNGDFNSESAGLTAPKEYNFLQGQVYRLRLTQILPDHPGKSFYPTLEVAQANPKTLTFLAHSSVPLGFTARDFQQAVAGNLVVKVLYLPDRDNQAFTSVAGAEEVVTTDLEPGADPVAEAQRRGTILAIIRLGNIDLENRASPAMNAVPHGGPMMMPPGAMLPSPMPVPSGPPRTLPQPPMPKAPTSSNFPTTLPSFIK
jgi:hypothetical protein